jgi:hypothetical protein
MGQIPHLMFEISINCSQESAHWFQVFNQRNGSVIGSLPTPGMCRSVVFPGDKVQSYPEDPHFAERTVNLAPSFQRKEPPRYPPSFQRSEPPRHAREELPTCPGQAFAGNRIGNAPTPLLFQKPAPISTGARSSQPSTRSVRCNNPCVPYTQGWPGATVIVPQNLFEDDEVSTPSVARMPSRSCQASRGEADSSNEESNSCNRLNRRKKGCPYIPPSTAGVYGGSDPFTSPGDTR